MTDTPVDIKEVEFLKRLHAMFRIEAEEHIIALSSGLIELEKNPKDKKSAVLIETIFREAHSLKGAARSVNIGDIESVCQILESIFAKVKNEQFSLNADQFDSIHKAVDHISKTVSGSKSSNDQKAVMALLRPIVEAVQPFGKMEMETAVLSKPIVDTVLSALTPPSLQDPDRDPLVTGVIARGDQPEREAPVPVEPAAGRSLSSETVRIPTSKLDLIFLQAEQMIQSKLASVQRTVDLRNISDFIAAWKTELRKYDSRRSVDNRHNVKELLAWTAEMVDETERNVMSVTHAVEGDQRSLGRMIDDHVEAMKKVLMMPIATMIELFPKLVRDLARSQGKEVELILNGKEIEVDKRILEELKDPLIHLLRNCIDHGIQDPKERRAEHKPPHGTITLNFAVKDGRNLEIRISDDGAGISRDRVLSASIKAGIVSTAEAEKLTPQESLDLIFHSGISTSPIITDISGRGLGLAIVREKVENLGGKVVVESSVDNGTTFRLFLPLTLSTFRGVLVRTGEHVFFIPTDNVERVLRVNNEMIKTVESRETMLIGQEIIRVVKLSDVLGIHGRITSSSAQKNGTSAQSYFIQIVLIAYGTLRIGIRVDEIFDEQQILVKNLGRQLYRVRNISGAAVLGSGTVVPVLNISDVMKSAVRSTSSAKRPENVQPSGASIGKVLVADDSITSRTLIKNILETAEYDVITAVDGVDAFAKAISGEFDLLVSDVDMPRLNGFELTAKIRKEKKLSEMPVVLVTALDSKEDREHGIDVGANAYIIKSSFDQSNLLEVIRKLI